MSERGPARGKGNFYAWTTLARNGDYAMVARTT